ncbi:MAG: discoidin domain-containing protein, partial [Clostridia bacterium]|nr:discoidin domain-containing protein [Clostridia bacterium]
DGSSSVTGAPQVSVTIPAGGFMVAFGANNTKFMNIYNVVMEGAVLYNATMSVIYEAYASYSGSTLTVRYNNPKPASSNAISFLFVGNSTTYFNGTPIKFKAMAAAAGIEIDVVYCTYGSAFLSEFADPNHERGKAFRNHLASRKFDYVVLQDAAGRDYNTTKPQVEKLLPLIKANGAEALLYMRYSAASTVDQIRTNAIKHHNNYATLAKDYNLVCAPSADAFVHYAEKYNDPYTLYASDGGHHSKEGSYLIAATWLYSYLGVDPVGNTYTADLSSDMVQKLQECAKIACEEGYAYPGMDNDYQEDGVYYKNIAKGKKYTVKGTAYSGDWTDADANGNPLGKLTDGMISTNGGDTTNGCWKGTSVDITVNLEGVYNIRNVRIDLHGNSGWGIGDPANHTVKVAVSIDGTNFKDIGTATMGSENADGNWKLREFNLKTGSNISAKYVKLTLSNAANSFFWSSEIRIYGSESNNVANDANIALNKTYTAEGIYSNNGSTPYPDEDGKSMTDGIIGTSGSIYNDTAYAGFNKGTDAYTANGYASITVDLGKTYDLDKFVSFVGTSYDKNGAAGITAPASMSVYVSNDNSNWTKAGEANFKDDSTKGCEALEITATTGATGRYVQYRFVANKNWMMIAEVEAYGTESTVQPEPDEPTEPDYRLGDVNNDKTVDSLDYLLVKRACFKTYTLSDAEFKCADVNEDAVIDSSDYLLVKRIAFGTYTVA